MSWLRLNTFKGIALGFDYGIKRIGVAIANSINLKARPLKVLIATSKKCQQELVDKEVLEWRPSLFVVGLPVNVNGSRHKFANECEKFARLLESTYKTKVILADERWTSVLAKGPGLDDARAAAIIFQGVLDDKNQAN